MEEEVERKFGSEGATLFSKAEEILCAAAKGNALEGKISEVVKSLGNDLREDKLHHELCVMGNLSGISDAKTFEEIRQYFQLNKTSREHMPEVTKLMRIILCAATSTATSERSSSMLRRLKTWLRTSMSQARLTWLGVLQCHKELITEDIIKRTMQIFDEGTTSVRKDLVIKNAEKLESPTAKRGCL